MITLRQAVKVLGLRDDEVVVLYHSDNGKGYHTDNQVISVKGIKETYDMRKVKVKHITAHYYMYTPDDDTIGFLITENFKEPLEKRRWRCK